MEEINIEINKEELQLIVHSLASAQPLNKELEVIQFKLYHKLLFKLNAMK